eukprot:scpid80047/ scgid8413/ 
MADRSMPSSKPAAMLGHNTSNHGDVSTELDVHHCPVISVLGTYTDIFQVLYLWITFFCGWLQYKMFLCVPSTIFADHPGSRLYLLGSVAALLITLLIAPLSTFWYVLITVLAIPYIPIVILLPLFLAVYFYDEVRSVMRTYDTSHCFWVAHCHCTQCKGAVVGMVRADRCGKDQQHVMELESMYVSPRVRRRRLGWRLLEKVTQFAKAAGCTQLKLSTLEMHDKAVPMYRRYGYSIAAQSPLPTPWMAPVTDVIEMERKV